MFRNKVLVRAAPSSSPPPPPFLLLQVSFCAGVPAVNLDILCCRLSRRYRLACLPQPPTDALVVYQRCQSRAAAVVASEIAAAFPDASVGKEEEVVCSGSLVAKAVESGLRSLMLENGWRCVGESIYVQSTFAANEEKSDLCALNVEVRSGRNDGFEFVVSPDAFRFATHKISDVASSKMMETFQRSKEVTFDGCNLQTACTILPTLREGHVIGFSKILPSGQSLDKFVELCSLKHGLEMNYSYHAAVKVTDGVSCEKLWLPSPLVLQGLGLQPALKSVRASKAMSSLQSFMELLKAWNFFGQDQLVIKEQLLLNCALTLPTWDKAMSKLTEHTARINNSEDVDLADTNFMAKDQLLTLDFRTPKPAVFCSSSAKLCNTKVHEIALSLDDYDTGNGTSSVNHGCQSQHIVLTSSYKSQVDLLKPSFRRSKQTENKKMRYSSEQSDVDSSNKSSATSLPKSSCGTASLANSVNSSTASFPKQVVQVSECSKRRHSEFSENSCQAGTAKGKDYIPEVLQKTKTMLDTEKDVPRTKVKHKKSKSIIGKAKITATATSKTKPEVVKDEFTKKVMDIEKEELTKKVTKVKTKQVIDNNDLNSTTKTKTKSHADKDELTAKVMDHHKLGKLPLLTVADLKCFLSAKKAKVGGTKEVLIQRAAELLSSQSYMFSHM